MQEFEDILGELDDVTDKKSNPIVFATFVLDHSGSMSTDRPMCIDNFNEQIQTMKSKENVETFFTRVDFNDKVILTGPFPIKYVKEIKQYDTIGTTALNDAIAQAIEINEKMMNECKSKDKSSLIIVITDGHENASVEFKGPEGAKRLQERIKKLQDQGDWTFTFMGAGLDIQKYATDSLGIMSGNTMSFNKSVVGYDSIRENTSRGLDSYYDMRVRGGTASNDFLSVKDDSASGITTEVDENGNAKVLTNGFEISDDMVKQLKEMAIELQERLAEVDDGDEEERTNVTE